MAKVELRNCLLMKEPNPAPGYALSDRYPANRQYLQLLYPLPTLSVPDFKDVQPIQCAVCRGGRLMQLAVGCIKGEDAPGEEDNGKEVEEAEEVEEVENVEGVEEG